MAAVKIQHKNCLQLTLRKKIINTLFAGLGRSVLGKTVPSDLSTAVLKTSGTVFPNTDLPAGNNLYICMYMYNLHGISLARRGGLDPVDLAVSTETSHSPLALSPTARERPDKLKL